MGLLDMFDKLDDIVYKPVETICEWIKEPLKRWEYNRSEESKDREVARQIETATAERKIDSEIRMKESEKQADIQIRRETEVVRIIAEIEEMKKDKAFERFKGATESLSKFQQEFTKLNVNAIWAIGEIQLELRNKAQEMVQERMNEYKEFQRSAMSEAMEEIRRIETDFSENDRAKEILYKAVDKKLNNIIETAQNFLKHIHDDLANLNKSIQFLAESGQNFIDNHLKEFRVFGISDDEIKKISMTKVDHNI